MSALAAPTAVPTRPAASAPAGAAVLRRCACGGKAGADGECEECRQKRMGVQRSAAAAGPAFAPPIVHEVLAGPGRPLDAGTRAALEPRFGYSFAHVRVHDDARAAASARSVAAHAYTVGRDVVFAAGRYRPQAPEGRRLIAHELAHVVQQDGADAALQPRLEVGATDAPAEREAEAAAGAALRGEAPRISARGGAALRRIPGENAQESWDAVVETPLDVSDERRAAAVETVRRMLATPSGARLANGLWTALCTASGCRSRIRVHFVDRLPEEHRGEAGGFFEPDVRGAVRYHVHVQNRLPSTSRAISLGSDWPGGTRSDIHFTHTDPESSMAHTLYHEALHVWFINTQTGATYPTGHGDVLQDQIEPLFLDRIRAFMGEMDALEAEIHRAAAAPVPAPSPYREPRPAPTGATEPRTGPSPVGFSLSGDFGGGGIAGRGAGTGILGANLILGNLTAFHLGARGVYLTPDTLLAGGTVGLRVTQGDDGPATTGGRVERPLFFDVEAGVLAEIPTGAATRFTTNFAGIAGLGVGQEFGRAGPRFFWRVGGFVVISDRPAAGGGMQAAGGGTAGIGVHFQ